MCSNRLWRNHDQGIALVVVLWFLALLSVLILTFSGNTRIEFHIALNEEQTAEARAIADAGVTFAILGMLDPSPTTRWRADGENRELQFGGGTIRVAVQDECGKIDLNEAPPDLLAGLFHTLGLSETETNQLVTAILTRRADVLGPGRSVSETDFVLTAQQIQKPFMAIDEFRRLPGVTRALFERLKPFLTVYSGQAGVNPLTASTEVLESLPGATPDMVAAYIAARSALGSDSTPLPPLVGVSDIVGAPVHVFTITSEGASPAGARFIREAVVDTANISSVRILLWRQAERQVMEAAITGKR